MNESASVKRCPCPEHEGRNPLPVSEFGEHRGKPDGLRSRCRACENRPRRMSDAPRRLRHIPVVPAPPGMKYCSCPDHEGPDPLPVSEFNKNRSRPDGLQNWCKACLARYRKAIPKEKRKRNREKARKVNRRWNQANREKVREQARRRYRKANPEKKRESGRPRRRTNLEKERERGIRKRAAARDAVLGHYGRVCACPGCGATENLTIDHVNGDGGRHRIELFGRSAVSYQMYCWIIQHGFPEGFQVLCLPCNASKKNGPVCLLDHDAA